MTMVSIDVAFSRRLLAQVKPEVEAAGKRLIGDAWVLSAGRDHWEFHGPDKYYWHGRAGNAYEARYKGWTAWLEKKKEGQPLAIDDEAELVSEYDFSENAMGLGDWVQAIIKDLPDHEIVVTVYDEQGRGAKSAKFIRKDEQVSLIIEFDRSLG